MKLYPVTITYKTMVVAESIMNAELIAENNLDSICQEEPDDVVVQDAIEDEKDLPPEWVNALPYGENNELRCNEIARMSNKDKYIKSLTKEQMNKILSHLTVKEISILLKK
jgi:hypothetical protein